MPSGDSFPIFVVAFCLFDKPAYVKASASINELKIRHFGHDAVVLHERDIRRRSGDFVVLNDPDVRTRFMNDLTEAIDEMDFKLVAAIIDKRKISRRDDYYEMAMRFGLERVALHYGLSGVDGPMLHLVAEKRSARQDAALELAFHRQIRGDNFRGCSYPFDIRFAPKGQCVGMEIADLVAYPTGRLWLDPDAYKSKPHIEVIRRKFRRDERGKALGWGLKVFP